MVESRSERLTCVQRSAFECQRWRAVSEIPETLAREEAVVPMSLRKKINAGRMLKDSSDTTISPMPIDAMGKPGCRSIENVEFRLDTQRIRIHVADRPIAYAPAAPSITTIESSRTIWRSSLSLLAPRAMRTPSSCARACNRAS
jgi:hypothetical protein